MAIYATFVAVFAVIGASTVPQWPSIVLWHTGLVVAMLWLPPRGAAWERARVESLPGEPHASHRSILALHLPGIAPDALLRRSGAHGECRLPESSSLVRGLGLAADRALFGGIPAVMLSERGGPVLDDHARVLLLVLPVDHRRDCVRLDGRGGGGETPAPGFETAFTCMMLGFLLSYVWYPFLPARGPWENPAVMSGLRPFDGWVFTRSSR